jgi:hypothetical protein
MSELKFQTVTGEKSRTYFFPGGPLRIESVVKLCVRDSGTHRIETADGKKYIVASGWSAIEIEADAWSF